MSYYIIIATAGHDTTSSTIAGGLLALLQNPPEMERLRADPAILAAGGVDEMVRWVTPVKHFFRTAVEDYELRGKTIRAGEHLMMCYPSANRDADAFPTRSGSTSRARRTGTSGSAMVRTSASASICQDGNPHLLRGIAGARRCDRTRG
jgi:cytochrome P450